MKKTLGGILVAFVFLFGCKNYEEHKVEVVSKPIGVDSVVTNAIGIQVEDKVFETKAVIKMKVKDVQQRSFRLEEDAIAKGGFVISSDLSNHIIKTQEQEISEDSIVKVVEMQKRNTITLKVPTDALRDHVRFAINQGIYVETLKVENTELTFKKLENDLNLEQSGDRKTEDQIEDKVWKALLGDQLKYATITYKLEEEIIIKEYNAPNRNKPLYDKLNWGLAFKKAWNDGIYGLKMLTVYLVKLTPSIGGIVVLFFGIRLVRRLVIKSKAKKMKNN
ncbi:hypothetical protein [Faecalibacter sp. LW9]|uniref:hypothetical protein n=1 Tax=Faecalibacter sp. LW9 TaxID=3103144 RepID=UPI002AFF2AC8|nr:hypothetical protein [Faecalibacter sp. LW9]